MKVLVTGGTGFVGSHTVAALLGAGHHVRLLARSPDRVRPALDPLGIGEVEAVSGDVTDADSVRAALHGCDTVVHAASVYSLDPRRSREILRTNAAGTAIVLGEAADAGFDPIVHVSSLVALMGERGAVLTPDSEPLHPPGPYARSKAESERIARRFQQGGAPIVITYPGSVWGPHDPYLGENCQVAINALRGMFRFAMPGGIVVSDVRDVAALHAALLEPGRGPRRYLALGERVSLAEGLERLSAVTGRRLRTTTLPAPLMLGTTKAADVLQRALPVRLPFSHEAVYAAVQFPRWDDSKTRREFGHAPRPLDETLRDTVHWLFEQGHISAKLAGRVAEEPAGGDAAPEAPRRA